MADRYWVGGTASWDGTAGTKWATTSGGAGGATVPTTADNVFFTNLSTGTCTIAAGNTGAASVTCTGFGGTLSFSAAITIAGSLTLDAGMTVAGAARITFTGTGTLTSAGKNIGVFTVNVPGGTFGLGDACVCTNGGSQAINITAGTFNTNNFNLTYTNGASNSIFNISGTTTRTVNLGSSTLTFAVGNGTCWDATTTTNLTFNAGTSSLVFTGTPAGGAAFNGGGLSYYNVSFNVSAASTTARTINGANTFNNLTFTNTATGLITHAFAANQTINGNLVCSGNNAVQRNFLRSNTLGTQRTLTVAGTVTGDDCDFRDILISGAGAGASPTRAGDCKGNGGITFPAAKTVYWNLAAGGNWSATGWAASSGGAPAVTNFPLPQDSAIVEATGLNTGTTLTIDSLWNIGSIDLSARTANTVTLASGTNAIAYYGDYKLGTGVTVTGTGNCTFIGRVTQNITSAARTIPYNITIDASGTTFKLLDAFASTAIIGLNQTTIDLNSQTLTALQFTSSNTNTRTIAFGSSGSFILTGTATAWTTATNTNLTITGTGEIRFTNAGTKTFAGGNFTFPCTVSNYGAGALTITGSNTITTLANGVSPTTFSFTAGTTTTVTNWNISGTAGNLVTIQSATAANHTLSKASGTVSADYLSISRSTATGGAAWYAGANSTDGGNNTGWIFSAAAAVIAVMAASEVGPDTFAASATITSTGITAAMAASEVGPDTFTGSANIGAAITAAMAASEVGPDILAANAFIGYKVTAAMAASEVGPDIFAGSAFIGTPPPPVAVDIYLIKLRSFTEHRRF